MTRCGHAYVRTALAYPGHFAVIFRDDLVSEDDPQCVAESIRAYGELQGAVAMIRDHLDPDLDVDRAATLCWAAMQDRVVLAPKLQDVADSTGTTAASLDDLVESFTDVLIDGFRRR